MEGVVKHAGKNIIRRGKAAVGNNALHIFGQLEPACKQNGGGAHRNAVKHYTDIVTELIRYKVYPIAQVHAFMHAEGDIIALAVTVCAMVYKQKAEAMVIKIRHSRDKIMLCA